MKTLKRYIWTTLFFALPLLGVASCQYGCAALDGVSPEAKTLVKETALTAALIGLDLAAVDVKEIAAVKGALEQDVFAAFQAGDDAATIGKELKSRLLVTGLSEAARALALARIRSSLTGEEAGATGGDGTPEQVAFAQALAAEL